MTRKLPGSIPDYVKMLTRRKKYLLWTVCGIVGVVVPVSMLIPKDYKSETLILVEPQKIPEAYVRATVTSDVTDRLQTIQEEIMSRTRLASIITDLNLYPKERAKKSMDELVEEIRQDITVEVINDNHPEKKSVGAFRISFLAGSPQTAHDVTAKIADLFIQENLKVRDQQAQGTSHFISDEAQKAQAQLEVQEEKIKAFNAKHMGALPEQEQTNLQMVGQYQSLEQSNSEAIDRATQQRTYLQSMLNVSSSREKTAAAPLTTAQMALQKKKQELASARQKYTDSHPEVVRLEGDVAALQQEVAAEPKLTADAGPTASQAEQFKSQLASVDQELKERTSREAQLEGQIRSLQGRVNVTPDVEAEFADLNRDYQVMQKNYQTLMEKQDASGMAAELERRDQSEQFRVLDPASMPTSPYSPNMLLINGGGIVVALVLGLALALLIEIKDVAIRDAGDIEKYLNVPLISSIPALSGDAGKPLSSLKQLAAAQAANRLAAPNR
jgi:polysaccharide chain length determinant protein (PEP-CTERM system associated)